MTTEELRDYLVRASEVVRIARSKLFKIAYASASKENNADYIAACVAGATADDVVATFKYLRGLLKNEVDTKRICTIVHKHLGLVGELIFDIWQSSSIANSDDINLGATVHVLFMAMAEIADEFKGMNNPFCGAICFYPRDKEKDDE